jgi:hypothetical protein
MKIITTNVFFDKSTTSSIKPEPLSLERLSKCFDIIKQFTIFNMYPRIVRIYINEFVDVERINFKSIKHKMLQPLIDQLIKNMINVRVISSSFVQKNEMLIVVLFDKKEFQVLAKFKMKK